MDNGDAKINPETYLRICELQGEKPDLSRIPPSYSEFPWYVKDALDIFNSLPDTYTSAMSPIYIGKDFSSLDTLLDLYDIDSDYRFLVFKIIRYLDSRAKDQAIRQAKQQSKK